MRNCIYRLEMWKGNKIAYYVCQRTKRHTTINACKNCPFTTAPKKPEIVPQMPKLTVRVWTYAEALKKWKKAGQPKRTQDEIDHIFETYCKQCKAHKKNKCLFCGCRVATNGLPIFNKIEMATEHCPKKLW